MIDILPYAAVFFSTYQGEVMTRRVRIVNRDEAPLQLTKLEPVGDHFTATLHTVVPGQEYELSVKVPSDTELGRFQEGVVVHTSHPTRPELPIAVNVLVKPDLYASPEVVDFGVVDLQQLRHSPQLRDLMTQMVSVARRDAVFEIRSVRSDVRGLDLHLSQSGKNRIFGLAVALELETLSPGPLSGDILVETTDPDFPVITIPVRGFVR